MTTKSTKPSHQSRRRQRNRRQNQNPYLPLDLQLQILSRLPSESVIRLRRVCKDWNTQTRQITFVCSNISTTTTAPRFVFETDVNGEYTLAVGKLRNSRLKPLMRFPPFFSSTSLCWSYLVCACNGLLCFVQKDGPEQAVLMSRSVYLCNPLLKETLKLPELVGEFLNVLGVGFDPQSKQFKVLGSVLRRLNKGPYVDLVVVCTVPVGGDVGKWRDIGDLPGFGYDFTSPVPLKGRIHWCVFRDESDNVVNPQRFSDLNIKFVPAITWFDLSEEKFHEWSLEKLSLPTGTKWNFNYPGACLVLGEIQGCLALLREEYDEANIRVWVMEQYGDNNSWCLKFCFDTLLRPPLATFGCFPPVLCHGTSEPELWVCYATYIACYNTSKRSRTSCAFLKDNRGMYLQRKHLNSVRMTPFVASLVSFKGSLE